MMKKSFNEPHYLARRARNEARLTDAGIYGPEMEHDACGVGFVEIGRAVQQECRDRYRMPSSA